MFIKKEGEIIEKDFLGGVEGEERRTTVVKGLSHSLDSGSPINTEDMTKVSSDEDSKVPMEGSEMELFEEKVEEVYSDANADGFQLDFISKIRKTGDQLRRNFLSRLAYEKIWLT